MTKTGGKKIIKGMKEAVKVARGEKQARTTTYRTSAPKAIEYTISSPDGRLLAIAGNTVYELVGGAFRKVLFEA